VVKFRFYRRIVCRIYTRLFNFCIPGIFIFKRFNFRKKRGSKKLTTFHFLTAMANGYVTFVISLVFIGACTAVIGDVAAHLGCFINLKDGVNAIAFVALGTSVPGTKLVGFIKMVSFDFVSGFTLISFVYCIFYIVYLENFIHSILTVYFIFYIVYSRILLLMFTLFSF